MTPKGHGRRFTATMLVLGAAFAVVAGQLIRLGATTGGEPRIAAAETIARTIHRPAIVDRHGRLIASDASAPSLFADPSLLLDSGDALDQLAALLPDLDTRALRPLLSDRSRRFVWIRRGLSPRLAQAIHELGIPGLAFRNEPRRVYPAGSLAGHLVGYVDVDNQGVSGIERAIDERRLPQAAVADPGAPLPPLRLTVDLGVQHGVEAELADAVARYGASGAAAVLIEADTGAVLAMASLPAVEPRRPASFLDPARVDKVAAGSFELGSIFKAVTIAEALDAGRATLDSVIDVRTPLRAGPYAIRDLHPAGRPLSVREIFVQSSNVGAAMLALEAGADGQRTFLERLGLLEPMRTEAGAVAVPQTPRTWGRAETITIAYGHGLAVAPLQFAAAAATLVNGGLRISPHLLADRSDGRTTEGLPRAISASTSASIRELMRRNVTHPKGTGRRAAVPGLEVGGKTGTAERPGRGGYLESSVVSSFLAIVPASRPRYVLLLSIFDPRPVRETDGQITAGQTAAPAAGRLLTRIAPLLDLPAPAAGDPG